MGRLHRCCDGIHERHRRFQVKHPLNLVPGHIRNWMKKTPSKCDLTRPLLLIRKGHSELPDLSGDIRVWTGWPIFNVKVVQFEINQWMQATGLVNGLGVIVRPQEEYLENVIHDEVELAEAALLKIMEWNWR